MWVKTVEDFDCMGNKETSILVADAVKRIPMDLTGEGLVFKLSDGQGVYLLTSELEEFLLQKIEEGEQKEYQYRINADGPSLFEKIFG